MVGAVFRYHREPQSSLAPDPIFTFDLPGFGPLQVYWYGLFLLAGTVIVLAIARTAVHADSPLAPRVLQLWVYCLVATIVGARLGALILGATSNPIGRRGFVSASGLGLGALMGYVLSRRWRLPQWTLADSFAPAVAFGEAVTRVGALLAGTAYGRPTVLPWGIVFTNPAAPVRPLGVQLHPTQVYLALGLAAVGAMALWAGKRYPGRGLGAAVYLMAAGVLRLGVEPMRGDRVLLIPPVTVEQVVGVVFVVLGIAVWYRRS